MPERDANEAFSIILRLEPWFVENVDVTSECVDRCNVHDRVQRTWRHSDICDAECFVTAKIPRCDCPKCGVRQLQVPWAGQYPDIFIRS